MATTSFRAVYRTRQVFHALRPRIDAVELDFARSLMTSEEDRLFSAMELRDQRHALAVMRHVKARTDERDVLLAALLHDCGKGGVAVWLRVLHVVAPKFGETIGRKADPGWRGSAYRLHHHVSLSAELAAGAGCSDLAVRLIAGQPRPEEADIALILREADDSS